jgi:predicted CopG family antitoxin
MSNAIRKTIDFSDSMYVQIEAHSKEQGCRSFSEAVRDIVRVAKKHGLLAASKVDCDPKFLQNRVCKDSGSGGDLSREKND